MSNPTDFWSDPEMFQSGDFIKFENVGDTVSGTITAIRKHLFDDGKIVPQIELDTPDGPKTLTAGQIRLKAELAEKRPGVGDHLTVTLTGIEKRTGGKTLKLFSVVVGPVATQQIPPGSFAQTVSAAQPTATVAADPLAGISPEAIAAIKGLL